MPTPMPAPEAVWINKPLHHEHLTETPEKAPEGAGHGRPDFCEARSGMTEHTNNNEVSGA